MSDTATPENRGKVSADVDSAAAAPDAPGHDEWALDEAIQESFAASDPPSTSQPGSTVGRHYASDRSAKLTQSTGIALAAGALVVIAVVLLIRR